MCPTSLPTAAKNPCSDGATLHVQSHVCGVSTPAGSWSTWLLVLIWHGCVSPLVWSTVAAQWVSCGLDENVESTG